MSDDDGEPELGPDGDLVSAMISTAIIPRVCKLLEGGALDPYSSKGVRTIVDLAEQIEVSTEKDGLKFQVRSIHPSYCICALISALLDVLEVGLHRLPVRCRIY